MNEMCVKALEWPGHAEEAPADELRGSGKICVEQVHGRWYWMASGLPLQGTKNADDLLDQSLRSLLKGVGNDQQDLLLTGRFDRTRTLQRPLTESEVKTMGLREHF